jgi:hypothetical protein
VDTTEAGWVQFLHTHITVPKTQAQVQVPVVRKGGCAGALVVEYATQQTDIVAPGVLHVSAVAVLPIALIARSVCLQRPCKCRCTCSLACAGLDFVHTAGSLMFESGGSKKFIVVPFIGTPKEGTFTVCLKTSNAGIMVCHGKLVVWLGQSQCA